MMTNIQFQIKIHAMYLKYINYIKCILNACFWHCQSQSFLSHNSNPLTRTETQCLPHNAYQIYLSIHWQTITQFTNSTLGSRTGNWCGRRLSDSFQTVQLVHIQVNVLSLLWSLQIQYVLVTACLMTICSSTF